MRETELISTIKKRISKSPTTILGIGDDAAIIETVTGKTLLCSDMMVEGVHFETKWTSAFDLGYKALASTLSDIAAMNGTPVSALVSLAIPNSTDSVWIDDFFRGADSVASNFEIEIVGGDLSRSPGPVFVDVCCYGSVVTPILRSGAKPGDLLAVSGFPGLSAAGLHALRTGETNALRNAVAAHLKPMPRFDLLKLLDQAGIVCSSMIDVSDGLSTEAAHIARASNVEIEIRSNLLPVEPQTFEWAEANGLNYRNWTFSGGEDYELLITFPAMHEAKLPSEFKVIGRAAKGAAGVFLIENDGRRSSLDSTGFEHFPKR